MLQINILGMHKEKENKQKSLKKSTEELLTRKFQLMQTEKSTLRVQRDRTRGRTR